MAKRHRQSHVQNQQPGLTRFWWVLGGAVIVLGAILFGLNANRPRAEIEVRGAPELKLDREKIDLGDIHLGQMVEVAFEVINVGDQPLRFKEPPYIEIAAGC